MILITPAIDFRVRYSTGRLESIGTTALAQVDEIDLDRFRSKLMDKLGWSSELCEDVEDRYRMFLALMLLYPGKDIVPTPEIDEFWHAHILDTVAYHRDCDLLFGSYQHHAPSFPDDAPEEEEKLRVGSDVTRQLYLVHFGVEPWFDAEICNCQDETSGDKAQSLPAAQ